MGTNRMLLISVFLLGLAGAIFTVSLFTPAASALCSTNKRYKTIAQGSLYAYHEIVPVEDPYCLPTSRQITYYFEARELNYAPIYEIYTQYARAWVCGTLFYYGGPLDQNSVSAQYFNSSTTSSNTCANQADLNNFWDNGTYAVWDYINI